jgi:site-specific DNA recombinase
VDQGIPIPVPAIIGDEWFSAVAERLEENRKRARQSCRGARHLFQGLIVCRRCGYAFHGTTNPASRSHTRRKYTYYRCGGIDAHRFGGERICRAKLVRADLLEQTVWQDVCSLLQDPGRIEREYQRRLKQVPPEAENKAHLQARIQKHKRGIGRLIDAYEEGLLEKGDFEPRVRQSRERLLALEAEVKKQSEGESRRCELRLVIGHVQELADRVKVGLNDADWQTRREIIRALVNRVEVDESQIDVIYRVDSLPFDRGPRRGHLQHCSRRRETRTGSPDTELCRSLTHRATSRLYPEFPNPPPEFPRIQGRLLG